MSIFNRRKAAAFVASLMCSLVVGCHDPVSPSPLAQHQLLLLSHAGAVEPDIYRMNADGSERVRLTFDGAQYGTMSLSPDGQRFVYMSGCTIIWTMNVDGTNARPLTTFESRCNRYPRWSPDGKFIAFSTTREGPYSIYVMNPDGSDQHNVSLAAQAVAPIIYPWGWTPDGRVVFMHRGNGSAPLSTYTVKPDGTDQRRMFEREGDQTPRWSQDGSRIAFIREMDGRAILHVMNADGSNVRRLTNHDGSDELTADYLPENDHNYWSPDGKYLVFYRAITNVGHALHVIRADGTGLLNLSDGDVGVRFDGWSPDGRITLHRKTSLGSVSVFLVNPDGSGPVNLTRSVTNDFNALWLPRR
jgi:TolB protein